MRRVRLLALAAIVTGAVLPLLGARPARADFSDGGGFSWGSYWAVVPPACVYSVTLGDVICTSP